MVRLKYLLDIYEKEVKVNVKNKKRIYEFEKHKMEFLVYICDLLNNNLYKGCSYKLFLIREPKVRLIMSESIIDKKEINYIILDNLDIIKINKDDNNKYYEYLIKGIIISLVRTNTSLHK